MEHNKRCTKCNETLPVANFYVSRQHKCGRRSSCKKCDAEVVKKTRSTKKGAKARSKVLKRHARTDKRRKTQLAFMERRKELQALATPPWSPLFLIADVYAEAERLTLESGIVHQVHHIMPIMEFSGLFVGLHVPWNLEILTMEEHVQAHVELRRTYNSHARVAKKFAPKPPS